MRVLFDCSAPFLLTHGGHQVQIEQTAAGLRAVGVDVEMLRWWDDRQSGDIIHFFGRPSAFYISMAHGKGMRVVLAELLTGVGSRTRCCTMKAICRTSGRRYPRPTSKGPADPTA
jgi:hypothetical protein